MKPHHDENDRGRFIFWVRLGNNCKELTNFILLGATDFSSAFDTGGLTATGGVLPGVTGAHHTPAVGEPEQCKVCGDYASGVHFGVLTCEGCKVGKYLETKISFLSWYFFRGYW